MRSRIGLQLVGAVGLVLALAITLFAALTLRAHRQAMIGQMAESADLLSETVKRSTQEFMLHNHRESLQRQIAAIGAQERVERVRVFNKEGRIVLSSAASDVGRVLDKQAESCFACHQQGQPLEKPPVQDRVRFFRGDDGRPLLGIVTPIPNAPSCTDAACHAHPASERLLGVLDVTVSLAEVERQVAADRDRIVALALVAIVGAGLLLWWLSRRLVVRPVAALTAGTRRVAAGDLTTTIPVTAGHELGELARAFNEMTRALSEAQRQLAQADKLASVGRLADGVAHEINNPLTGVLSYASLLLEGAKDDPAQAADLAVIVRETKRCREIVRGLLDFARQTPPQRRPTDLNDVARRAIAVVMNQLQLRHVGLALDLADDLPTVAADPNQMQQVVVNLLLNAADAVGERGGTIRLGSRRTELPPRGHVPIRRAVCPHGCDLLDPSVRIGGLPAIAVLGVGRSHESPVRLDPVYGRANHASPAGWDDGVLVEVQCPHCRVSLVDRSVECAACGAPTFAVRGPNDEPVRWCSRKGCHETRWDACDRRGPRAVVELAVADDGRGIPPEALSHVFEPFFTTKGVRGTGLGLAVTWGIVEAHGGTIEVQSEVGRGTCVTVRVPLDAATAATPPAKQEAA